MFLCNKGRDKLPGGTEYKLSQGKIFCPKQTTQGDSQNNLNGFRNDIRS